MLVVEYEKPWWYVRFRTPGKGHYLDYGRFKIKEEAEARMSKLKKLDK